MINVNIISKVEIPVITEEMLAELVKAEIAKNHPEVVVTDIEFSSKLNPKRIEGVVSAHIGSHAPKPVQKEEQLEMGFEEPVAQEEPPFETEQTDTVADMFKLGA